MPTLMQKIRLAFRGWQRRRAESDQEFVSRNAAWGKAPVAATAPAGAAASTVAIDVEGLTVAYLDDSGQFAHFFDTESGDIVDLRLSELESSAQIASPRYRRIPVRTETDERDDRRVFAESLDVSPIRDALARSADAGSFRKVLAAHRTIERAWYNFRNDRAIAAIEAWIATL